MSYHDPHVASFPSMRRYQIDMDSVELTRDVLEESDCVVIVTNHKNIDYGLIADAANLIVDTRNAVSGKLNHGNKLVKA